MPVDEGFRVSFERERQVAFGREASGRIPAAPVIDLEDVITEIEVGEKQIAEMIAERIERVAEVFHTLEAIRGDLDEFFPTVPELLPASLGGRLVAPDGSPAAGVAVEVLPPPVDPPRPWPRPQAFSDERGAFSLALPPRPVPDSGLTLLVRGAGASSELTLRRADLVAGAGDVGVLVLERPLAPLPRSVVAQLGDVAIPAGEEDVAEHPEEFADPAPTITLGEGDCARSFRAGTGVVDRFGYSMLVRLIAPELSGRRLGTRIVRDGRATTLSSSSLGLTKYISADAIASALTTIGDFRLVERVPVEAPIDITRFRDAIERAPEGVPKAASLGLGYVVRMQQVWIPAGLSLGDLVYSLPLAPGEQQRIAVSDTRETLSVREQEALTASERQRYDEVADSSTQAVFRSSFDEEAAGGSRMSTEASGGAIGLGAGVGGFFSGIVAGLGIAGGYSSSGSSGSSSSWQNASRDYVSNASQSFHGQLSRQASARREASRASVRLASATERQEVTTKVITNHNHCHALTMQYWQVLRHFSVTSTVDDVQLVCFVPFEVVGFLPRGQALALPDGDHTRAGLLGRYAMLLRYHDVLAARLRGRPDLMHGLRTLRTFAGNPTMVVESSGGAAQDIVNVSVKGTFLPFEDVYVSLVATTGARVGPVRLVPGAAGATVDADIGTRAGLVEHLRTLRAESFDTRTGALALPEHIARSSVARIELSRAFRPFSYRLGLPSTLSFTDIAGYFGNLAQLDVTLSPGELERELGGPVVEDPSAKIGGALELLESYNGPGGAERMPPVMPVSARRLPPELAYADLLRIEAVLQHVVQNTVPYSKAVWQSLTPEERAILLERYTIGVPSGGLPDASQEVPLLNCVANEVLGYFGNAAIMPFFIPPTLAGEMRITSRDVQEALLRFHRQSFVPPRSAIALPSRGVLGEAVLGSCNACEKIDLTRFWNWQDSPADQAADPAAAAALFAGGNQLVGPGGAVAPNALTTGPMVTINQGPSALTPADLATKLIAGQPASNLPQDLTGITQLGAQLKVQTETTAESLNKTISEASGLAKAAMEAVPKAIEAKKADDAKDAKDAKDEKETPTGGGGGTGGSGGGGGGTAGSTDGGAAPPGP